MLRECGSSKSHKSTRGFGYVTESENDGGSTSIYAYYCPYRFLVIWWDLDHLPISPTTMIHHPDHAFAFGKLDIYDGAEPSRRCDHVSASFMRKKMSWQSFTLLWSKLTIYSTMRRTIFRCWKMSFIFQISRMSATVRDCCQGSVITDSHDIWLS